jgi:hypothetical protein
METRVHGVESDKLETYNIHSSKPVAVFSGRYCKSGTRCSNIIEQIPPSNQLDTVYIVPPNYKTFATLVYFLSEKNTTVTMPDKTIKSIYPGRQSFHTMFNNHAAVIKSAEPILMTSFTVAYLGNYNPYWTVVPGVNQYLPRYKIVIPTGYNTNYIAVMIKASAVGELQANCKFIDRNTVRFQENVYVDDIQYTVIVAEVPSGELTLESIDNTPFGLMVYGHRKGGGYGFAGNVILR